MVALMFGHLAAGAPADENTVRRNTQPVDNGAPPAEAEHAPDFNMAETDPNPEVGMAGRQVASAWTQGTKGAPAWKDEVNAQTEHNAIIDRQISTSGTAAEREASGEFGHGSMSYAYGIEAVHDLDGGKFGNEYFAANQRDGVNPNSSAKDGLQPTSSNSDDYSSLATYGKDNARDATASSLYSDWYSGLR